MDSMAYKSAIYILGVLRCLRKGLYYRCLLKEREIFFSEFRLRGYNFGLDSLLS